MTHDVVSHDAALAKAASVFGIRAFRPGQWELIDTVLQSRDALGVLPVGAGKSLCFQVASLFLPGRVLVISPQASPAADQNEVLGHDLIHVAPEHLQDHAFLCQLQRAGCSLMVVDEAHCASQWSHDFRPAYLSLNRVADALGRPPILALTANTTPAVQYDISSELTLRTPRVVHVSAARPNMHLGVLRHEQEAEKLLRLRELVRHEPGCALVYCATIRAAEAVFASLLDEDIPVGIYHGKLHAALRAATQCAFMAGRYRVVVATKIFCMGIDQPCTRLVVHYQVPDSLDSYYREVGRAGRDGQPARGVLLHFAGDARVQRYFLAGKYPRRVDQRRFLAWLGARGSRPFAATDPDLGTLLPESTTTALITELERLGVLRVAELGRWRTASFSSPSLALERKLTELYTHRRAADRERFAAMLGFVETRTCRSNQIQRYFGETAEKPCAHCDVCDECSQPVILS